MDLLTAVKTQSLDTIRNIVEQTGIPVDHKWTDYSALNESLKLGKSDVSKYLLSKNCRINKTVKSSLFADTPLHNAIKLKDIDVVKCLLEKKASVTVANAEGNSPLHLAFILEQSNIIDLLLVYMKENSIYMNSENQQGLSHLHIACTRENKEIIEKFLEEGARVSESVKEDSLLWSGYSALHFAVHYKSLAAVKVLLNEFEKFEYEDENDMKSSCTKLLHKDIEKSLMIADLLSDYSTRSPLHFIDDGYCRYESHLYFDMALMKKDTNTIKRYFANGVTVGRRHEGESRIGIASFYPLHLAVESNCKKNVELLLNKDVDITDTNYDNMTPLHLSLYNEDGYKNKDEGENEDKDESVIDLTKGEDESEEEDKDEGPDKSKNDTIVDMLYKAVQKKGNHTDNNGLSYLHVAVTRNDLETVEYYLDDGNDINSQVMYDRRRFYHFSPLHFATLYKKIEVAKLLIDRGANVNLSDDGEHGTPLLMAVVDGNVELIELLLENGADVEAVQPKDHWTVLHNFVKCFWFQVLRKEPLQKDLLLYFNRFVTMGCDINAQDNSGNTALHQCCGYFHRSSFIPIIVHLLECGADVNLQNHDGKTPLPSPFYIFDDRDECEMFIVLYNHIEKLKALDMMVHPKNVECCKKYLEKIKKCKEHAEKFNEKLNRLERLDEIAKLKKTVISDCKRTSLYDLLIVDPKYTTIKFSVSLLEKTIKDENFEKNYPSYGYLIRLRFQQLSKRMGIRMPRKRTADDQLQNEGVVKRLRKM